ncbi:unnamed protein product [Vitrella brassicaformis CCMP3155]|uniref:Ubiquitin-like domain-containing protein n=2 Tax=Vitrella brassicaformis TaxID=1169539 RepID=A0A0G4FZ11_VITBC|nr:unnamed protein product [Vitrella brassicaformis CCMP3155]|eukprot:CEM20839.1 unnamed protein product [Vitrella brassicaformis CCMP3155]
MQLFVRLGDRIEDGWPGAQARNKVADVCKQLDDVCQQLDVPSDALRLAFEGILLEPEKSLHYGIDHGCTLSRYFVKSGRVWLVKSLGEAAAAYFFPFPNSIPLSERDTLELEIPSRCLHNRLRLATAHGRGKEHILQVVGLSGRLMPIFGLFQVLSASRVRKIAEYVKFQLMRHLRGMQSTIRPLIEDVDRELIDEEAIRVIQCRLMVSSAAGELRLLAELADASRQIAILKTTAQDQLNELRNKDEAVSELTRREESAMCETKDQKKQISVLTKTTRDQGATIGKQAATIEELQGSSISKDAEIARLGRQDASLDAERLRGDRLHQISAAARVQVLLCSVPFSHSGGPATAQS